MEQYYTTKQISKICSVTRKALKLYQDKQLLIPDKLEKGKHLYSDKNIAQLQQILLLKKIHYSIEEIQIILLNEDWNPKYMFNNYQLYLNQRIKDYQTMIDSLKKVKIMHDSQDFTGIMNKENFAIFSYKKTVSSVIWKFWEDKNKFFENKEDKKVLNQYMKKSFLMYRDYLDKKIELKELYVLYEEIDNYLKLNFENYYNPYIKNLGYWWSHAESFIKIQINLCGFTLGQSYYETFLRFWQNKLLKGGYE